MQSQGAVISHVKQRGNHGVTVQPVVSGTKIHAQYFQREYNGVLSICGAARGGDESNTYCGGAIMYARKMQMTAGGEREGSARSARRARGCDVEYITKR